MKLANVAKYIRGVTFSPGDKVPPSEESVVCMRTKNIQSDLDESDLIAVPPTTVKRKEQFLRSGDILVSSANSWNLVAKCCYVPPLDYRATAGGFIAILRASERVAPRYLYHWLSWDRTQVDARACARQTTNIANLSTERFLDLEIPLPPLEEQRRIAAILDKADAIRRKRQKAIALTEQLLRSTFLEMFGDPVTNPKGWPVSKLGDLVSELRYGTSVKCSETATTDSTPILRIPNIAKGEVDFSELKYADLEGVEASRLQLRDGDILFVRSNGNPDYIGRCAVFSGTGRMGYASYLIRARLQPSAKVEPIFAKTVMSLPTFRSQLVKHARTTAGNYNISAGGLRSLELIHPPLARQRLWLSQASKIRAVRAQNNAQAELAVSMFNSLTQQAFTGQL